MLDYLLSVIIKCRRNQINYDLTIKYDNNYYTIKYEFDFMYIFKSYINFIFKIYLIIIIDRWKIN